jgi:hypothetical protein
VNAPDRLLAAGPASELEDAFNQELDSAALLHSRGQKAYASVQELSRLIGGEYGNRVVYELLQNAHDAHVNGPEQVAVRLDVKSAEQGTLCVANGGTGFDWPNVDAIRNIATSTKRVGEGIGNKGVGFRSVEAVTDDPRVYSCKGHATLRPFFDGYCFRFATLAEIERRLEQNGAKDAKAVAASLPRYLAAVPLTEQSQAVRQFAGEGYASVVELPLKTSEAVDLAIRLLRELIESDAPILLFLDRISTLEISISGVASLPSKTILSRAVAASPIADDAHVRHQVVTLHPGGSKWLVSRKQLPKERVLDSVRKSMTLEPGLRKWVDWRGEAVVSVAVPLHGKSTASRGRLFNFLPMGAHAECPFFGHLDAPFFTAINRERARLELPLNSYLLDAAAALAVQTALQLRDSDVAQSRLSVIDLLAWQHTDAVRLQAAFKAEGSSLANAAVWPTTSGGWASFGKLFNWPVKELRVFTATRTTKAGATNILETKLDASRRTALNSLAQCLGMSLEPDGSVIVNWAELVAASLHEKAASAETWTDYYQELAGALRHGTLSLLRGRKVLVDRQGDLVCASPSVYVRSDQSGRRRSDAPLPPAQIVRKLTILSDTCRMRAEDVVSFQKAGLCSVYVATEVLQRLPELFGDKPAESRRVAALQWAFEVWKFDTSAAQPVLKKAHLHVPTRSGWVPAADAAFSQTWSAVGVDVEHFLAEARERCEDADYAWKRLLADQPAWPVPIESKQDWVRFLGDCGVLDGLVPVAARVSTSRQGGDWRGEFIWSSDGALGGDWLTASGFRQPSHPYTRYARQGGVWKIPGQSIVGELSEEARTRFATLLIKHLQILGRSYLTFRLLREERDWRHQDSQTIKTPLAVFLEQQPWFPQEVQNNMSFVRVADAWVLTDRRLHPRFVPRAPDEIASLLAKDAETSELLAATPYGVQFWRDQSTAVGRMRVLADACAEVPPADRAALRKQYEQAWQEFLRAGVALPESMPIICEAPAGLLRLEPSDPPQPVYVRTESSQDSAKLLIESGIPLLATSAELSSSAVIHSLSQSPGFDPRPADQAAVELMVDGQQFAPVHSNPLLVDLIPWLPEAFVVGQELAARDLERSANISHVLERLRAIRVRTCSSINLSVGVSAAQKSFVRYMHRDESLPTLISTRELDASELGECAGLISSTIHRGIRTFEILLLKLAYVLPPEQDLRNVRPSESDYARALQVDADQVRDHLAAFRDDDAALLDTLLVVLGCELGVERASELREELIGLHSSRWAKVLHRVWGSERLEQVIRVLKETSDLALVREQLGLEYARFNATLIAMGRGSLTSEVELRRQFDLHVSELRPSFMLRLRKHYVAVADEGGSLADYQARRNLEFLKFDPEWVKTHEGLTVQEVEAYCADIFERDLGPVPAASLAPLLDVLNQNRKLLVNVCDRARPILRAILGSGTPDAWSRSSLEMTGDVEELGLLDFRVLAGDGALHILRSSGFWPSDVALSLELSDHNLTEADLDKEKQREQEMEAEKRRLRNLVTFGGLEFDASESDFPTKFASVAFPAYQESEWRQRSSVRTIALAAQPEGEPSRGGGGGGASKKKVTRPPDSVRAAMGLAGELLAFRYLEAKHVDRFSEACWVSENRIAYFPGHGDLSLGFDFRVNTKTCEWLYEVKATPGDSCEFELTDNEYRRAIAAAADRTHRYRILFVQHVFDPSRCRVLELPNPASEVGVPGFRIVGRSSVRMRFEPA